MDTTLWIIAAAVLVAVLALLAYRYRQELGLRLKGFGVEAEVNAKGAPPAKAPPGGRNVSIGGDATRNRIVTGDTAPPERPAAASGRNVAIGGNAADNTIVTGDGIKPPARTKPG